MLFPRLITLVGLMLLVSSCGLKGSLYLPDERAQEVSAQSPATIPTTEEEQRKQRSASPPPSSPSSPAAPTDTAPSTAPPQGN